MLFTYLSFAQVGIGTYSPDASSVLDVSSTNKGLLLPRMTTVERDAITSPAEGLMVYNTDVNCMQVNFGNSSSPNWDCIQGSTVGIDCGINGFEGTYMTGVSFNASNKFSVTVTNNASSSVDFTFANADITLDGVTGVTVASTSPAFATLAAGASQLVEYTLSGTPVSSGTLTGTWLQNSSSCSQAISVVNGDASFNLPQTTYVLSIADVSVSVDIPGVVDNGTNQITVDIPYTSGVGSYDAFSGTYTLNKVGTGEGGDANSFRLSYPSGTFSTSGNIVATIEVDGDGSFDVTKLLVGASDTIAQIDFTLNGMSKGIVNLIAQGGVADRNFADASHKFIYVPVQAKDGNVWLNNNLGANYSNLNDAAFNPVQQAASNVDLNAYGSLFQWGRAADGHELIGYINSVDGNGIHGFTNVQADVPANSLFIAEHVDWRVNPDISLWQGESGTNNPCPIGFRVPTQPELSALLSSESITTATAALNSTLKLTPTGYRDANVGINAAVRNETGWGYYWTSTVSASVSQTDYYYFTGGTVNLASGGSRASGMNVRCIKD